MRETIYKKVTSYDIITSHFIFYSIYFLTFFKLLYSNMLSIIISKVMASNFDIPALN